MSGAPNRHEMELIAAAAGAERANRPRWLVILSLVVLAAVVVYVGTSAGALAGARGELGAARAESNTVLRRIEAYRDAAREAAGRVAVEDPQTVRKLQDLADAAGLTVQVNERLDTAYDERGQRKRTLNASLRDADPSLFLSWVHAVMQAEYLRGIEIRTLTLRPGTPRPGAEVGWNIDVTFERLERRS